MIYCLKEGHAGVDILKKQLSVLSEPELNPFERLVSEPGNTEATPDHKLIDIYEENDIDIFLVTLFFILICKLFIFIWFSD